MPDKAVWRNSSSKAWPSVIGRHAAYHWAMAFDKDDQRIAGEVIHQLLGQLYAALLFAAVLVIVALVLRPRPSELHKRGTQVLCGRQQRRAVRRRRSSASLRFADVVSVTGAEPAGGPRGLPGLQASSVSLRTRAGVILGTGFLSPEITREIVGRLTPDQLAAWKSPPR